MNYNRRLILDTLAQRSFDRFLAALFFGEVDNDGVIYTEGLLQPTIHPNGT